MHHYEKKNSKIFSPERLHENVWEGPRENVFPDPSVALDGPSAQSIHKIGYNVKYFLLSIIFFYFITGNKRL